MPDIFDLAANSAPAPASAPQASGGGDIFDLAAGGQTKTAGVEHNVNFPAQPEKFPGSQPYTPPGYNLPEGQDFNYIPDPNPYPNVDLPQLFKSPGKSSLQEFMFEKLPGDIKQFGEGLGALSTASAQRYRDALIPEIVDSPGAAMRHMQQAYNDPINTLGKAAVQTGPGVFLPFGNPLLGQKPLFRVLGNQSEPSDIQTAARVAGAMTDQYGNYLQDAASSVPAVDAQNGFKYMPPTGGTGFINRSMYEKPFTTMLDALPVGEAAGTAINGGLKLTGKISTTAAAKGVPFAGKIATGADEMLAAREAAKAVKAAKFTQEVKDAAETLEKIADEIPGVKFFKEQLSHWTEINKVIGEHDAAFRRDYHQMLSEVQKAYEPIKNLFSDEDLYDIITKADPIKYAQAMASDAAPAVEQFMFKLNEAQDYLAQELIKIGALTPENVKVAKYGPSVQGLERTLTGRDIPQSHFDTPEGMQLIDQAEADAATANQIPPVYMSQTSKGAVEAAIKREGMLFGGVGRSLKVDKNAPQPAAPAPEPIVNKVAAGQAPAQFTAKAAVNREPDLSSYWTRTEEAGAAASGVDKPHGLYTAPADTPNPHEDLGGDTRYFKQNPDAKVLEVDTTKPLRTKDRGGLRFGGSSGVMALYKFLPPDVVDGLLLMGKKDLLPILQQQYPKVDWSKYYDGYEALEGYAGMLARDAGYDAIKGNAGERAFDEYVGLTAKALKEVPELPGRNPPTITGNIAKTFDKEQRIVDQIISSQTPAIPDAVDIPKPPQLYKREQGVIQPGITEQNPMKVYQATLINELGYLKMRDLVDAVAANPNLAGKGGVAYDLKGKLSGAAVRSGHPELAQALSKMQQGVIKLPALAANHLDTVLQDPGLIAKWWEKANAIKKNALLGANPAWAVQQTIQNIEILKYSMFKGPDDIGRSIAAFGMALDPKAKELGQKLGWTMDSHGEAQLAALATSPKKNPVKWFLDTTYNAATEGDNYARTVKGLHSLMRQIETAEPSAKPALNKALDIMARFPDVERAANDAKYAEEALKEIKEWFGDYSAAAAEKWKVARALDIFALWHLHALSLVKAARNTPVKNVVLNQLARTMPDRMQGDMDPQHKRQGFLPMYDTAGDPIAGPNGGRLLYGRSGFMPFTQVPELMEQVGNLGQQNRDMSSENPGAPASSPVLDFGSLWYFGRNPSSTMPLYNPELYGTQGMAASQEADGTFKKRDTNLNAPQAAVRSFFPQQEKQLRDIAAYPNVPSDFTNFSDANPQKIGPGQPKLNYSAIQQIIYNTTHQKPTEVVKSADEMAGMEARSQRKLQKLAGGYQYDRGQATPTWIEQMMTGRKKKDERK